MPNPQGDEAAASICVQDRGSKLLGRPPNSRIVYNSDELDGIYNGVRLTFPTDEEKKSLRRVPDSIPLNVYCICLVVLAERFSHYGTSVLLSDFIEQSGPLWIVSSTRLKTIYQIWCYSTPLLGAYIADTYWGRFKTAGFALFVALIGHVILIISAVLFTVDKYGASLAFVVALIITGLGTGLFNANIYPLVAEQSNRKKLFVIIMNGGERVIVDPALTVSRVYMCLYLFITLGGLLGRVTIAHSMKHVAFWFPYTISTLVFTLCPLVTWSGHRYIHLPPTGSVLATALRLFLFAARDKWNLNPVGTYRNFIAPGFWDNAKPSKQITQPEWMNFDDQWVDEVKRGFKACCVFCWFPIFWLTFYQLNQKLTEDALRMATHSIPDDVLCNLYRFMLLTFLPLCEFMLYPFLRRMRLSFSALKKITFGFMTAAAAMVWAAVVQHYIYKTNTCGNYMPTCNTVSSLFAWIQTGSPILVAFSEILVSTTGLEYAFTKAPNNMRSLVMSVYLFTLAFAAALDAALASISTELVRKYGALGVLSLVTSVLFWWSVKNLDAAEDELNNLPAGHLETKSNEITRD